jgi:hypothetical protein
LKGNGADVFWQQLDVSDRAGVTDFCRRAYSKRKRRGKTQLKERSIRSAGLVLCETVAVESCRKFGRSVTYFAAGAKYGVRTIVARNKHAFDGPVSEKVSIVIVEEDRDRALSIIDSLRDAGAYDIHVIAQITGLARQIKQHKPDIVLIDLATRYR